MSEKTVLLFVYGTLMRGQPNAALLATATPRGPACTDPAYTLLDLGEWPALVAGGRTAVVGELWDVDPPTLAALDELEGHPTLYRRGPVRLEGASAASAYFLVDPPPRAIVLGDGVWRGPARSR